MQEEDFYDFDELRNDLENLDLMRELLQPVSVPELRLAKDGRNARLLPLSWYFEVSELILKLAKKEKQRIENKLSTQLNKSLKLGDRYYSYDKKGERYKKMVSERLGCPEEEFTTKFSQWKEKHYNERKNNNA